MPGPIGDLEFTLHDYLSLVVGVLVHQWSALVQLEPHSIGFFGISIVTYDGGLMKYKLALSAGTKWLFKRAEKSIATILLLP